MKSLADIRRKARNAGIQLTALLLGRIPSNPSMAIPVSSFLY